MILFRKRLWRSLHFLNKRKRTRHPRNSRIRCRDRVLPGIPPDPTDPLRPAEGWTRTETRHLRSGTGITEHYIQLWSFSALFSGELQTGMEFDSAKHINELINLMTNPLLCVFSKNRVFLLCIMFIGHWDNIISSFLSQKCSHHEAAEDHRIVLSCLIRNKKFCFLKVDFFVIIVNYYIKYVSVCQQYILSPSFWDKVSITIHFTRDRLTDELINNWYIDYTALISPIVYNHGNDLFFYSLWYIL